MRHSMPPPPSPHNKSYDNIDLGGLVVWLTYTYTLIVIISINNTTVAIALSTIAITHLYIISIQIAIMSIVKPCLHISMK